MSHATRPKDVPAFVPIKPLGCCHHKSGGHAGNLGTKNNDDGELRTEHQELIG